MMEEEIKTYNMTNFQQAEIIITDSKTGKKMTLSEYRSKILLDEEEE